MFSHAEILAPARLIPRFGAKAARAGQSLPHCCLVLDGAVIRLPIPYHRRIHADHRRELLPAQSGAQPSTAQLGSAEVMLDCGEHGRGACKGVAHVALLSMLFRKWRGLALDDPVEPLRDYWACVKVRFSEPVLVDDPTKAKAAAVAGYFRLLGIRSEPNHVRSFIEPSAGDGNVVWEETEWRPVCLTELDQAIRKRVVPLDGAGVWYQSGRIFFPERVEEHEPS